MSKASKHLRIVLAALVAVVGYGAVQLLIAQTAPAGNKDDEQAIRKAADDFGVAYNKADLDALLAFWTADAEYIDTAGKVTRGRTALAAQFRKGFESHKAGKTKFQVVSLRFLKADVALEDGVMTVTYPDGLVESGRYSAVWVKNDGKWLLSNVRDLQETTASNKPAAFQRLKQLEWLVGDWVVADKPVDVHFTCRWDANQSFLLQQFTAKPPDGDPFTVTQRIGWDPARGQIRSWFFDSKGGFGEGYWSHDGHRWTVEASGVVPDGRIGTGRNIWTFVDDKTFTWQAKDREVDGDPLADVEVKLVRKPQKP